MLDERYHDNERDIEIRQWKRKARQFKGFMYELIDILKAQNPNIDLMPLISNKFQKFMEHEKKEELKKSGLMNSIRAKLTPKELEILVEDIRQEEEKRNQEIVPGKE